MIYEDYVSLILNSSEEDRKMFNIVWDCTHGECSPEFLYHHKIEETKYDVLSKWFNTFTYSRDNKIYYGHAWDYINKHKNYKIAFERLSELRFKQEKEANELFKKVFHKVLWRVFDGEFIVLKLLELLIKIKEKGLITEDKSSEYYSIIEHYKFKNRSGNRIETSNKYEFEFYQTIIELCKIWIERKNICS